MNPLEKYKHLYVNELKKVDEKITSISVGKAGLIGQLVSHIVNSGGKRLRPALLLTTARALGATPEQMQKATVLAAVVEFIHTATLLHDDVVDESDMRRGRLTANAQYGNAAAVLVGDFLYSRAFQMMVQTELMPVMDILSEATNTIAEGEVLQLLNCKDPEVTEERYMQVIHFKTAKLFEASCRLAAIVTQQNADTEKQLGLYGAEVGSAFQLIDDVLDYAGESATLGKNVGDDLREGKPTLPLIHAMQHAPAQVQTLIRQAISNGGTEEVGPILQAIEASGSLRYTRNKAIQLADQAKKRLQLLAPSTFTTALTQLCDLAVERNA